MIECPKCHQLVDSRAIACSYCRTALKAYGHPGIPLYRSSGEDFLCATCTYQEDDTCTLPQRPYAQTCTLYHDRTQPEVEAHQVPYRNEWHQVILDWCRRNQAWVILLGLALISFAIALSRR